MYNYKKLKHMKKLLLLSISIVSFALFSFTNVNNTTKGEKVFEVSEDGTIYLLPGQSSKISYEDAITLSSRVGGWTACDKKSVINQCETRLAHFPDKDTTIQKIIEKYNGN